MQLLRIIVSLKLVFGAIVCNAQQRQGVLYERFQKADGLSSNSIHGLAQDKDGFIWIATGKSLQRFDGHRFTTYTSQNEPTLRANSIRNVFCDSRNRLWIFNSHRGVGLWNLNTGEKDYFTPVLKDSTSLADARSFVIYEDRDSTIWLGIHLKGVARFNEKTRDFTTFNIDRIFPEKERRMVNTVRTIIDHPKHKDELLVGSFNGFVVLNKETGDLKQLPINKSNVENPASYNGQESALLDIFAQNDSILWIGTFGGGILRYNLHTQTYRSVKVDPPFPGNPVKNNFHQFLKRDSNSLWVSFYSHGLSIFDTQKETLQLVNPRRKETSELSTTLKMLKGKFGHLWLSSQRGLVKVFSEKGFADYQYLGYDIKDIEKVPEAKHKVILPYLSDHINILDSTGKKIREVGYKPLRKFDLNFLQGLHSYNEQIYLPAFEGLYYLNSDLSEIKPVRPFFEQLQEKRRLSIIQSLLDSRGNIWMSTKTRGLYRYNISEQKLRHFSPQYPGSQPVSHHWVVTLYEDKQGYVWFGSENGYGYFNHRTQSFTNFPYPKNSLTLDSIYFQECIGFAQNKSGKIWIGAKQGVLGLFQREKLPRPKLILQSQEWFRNQLLNQITEDEQQIYIRLNNGLTIVDKKNHEVRNFNSAFGANQIDRFLNNSMLAIGKGFASLKKLEINNLPKPKIYIDELMLAGKEVPFKGESIQVSFRENSISLSLGILDLIEKERARLEYRLAGQKQARWTAANSGQLLSFPYLNYGNYLLEVRAISPSGKVWDQLEIPIEVVPLPWQRWYIQLLLLFLALTLLSFPVIYRFRQKRRRQHMQQAYEKEIADLKNKALKAQVNPHFLFNCLNSIRLMVMKGDKDKATASISTFSRLVRRILVHSEKDEVSLNDELKAIREYITLEQMRFKQPFLLKEKIDENVDVEFVKVPPMLLQPFIENAIWHGLRQKKRGAILEITVQSTEGYTVITIRDNGIGRKAASNQKNSHRQSFGINISRDRLKYFRAHATNHIEIFDLYSDKGQALGTQVKLKIAH